MTQKRLRTQDQNGRSSAQEIAVRPSFLRGTAVFQIRIHGRGGQGVVTAAEMLALAGFMEGHHAQAFPSFGSERTGAPVVAFARLASSEIRLREPVLEPDVVLVQDKTLLESVDVFKGLREDGYVLINSSETPEALGLEDLKKRLPEGTSSACRPRPMLLKRSAAPCPAPQCSRAWPP